MSTGFYNAWQVTIVRVENVKVPHNPRTLVALTTQTLQSIAMPYLRHEESSMGMHPAVAMAAEVPPTQDSVAYAGNQLWDTYFATEGVSTANGTLSWNIPASTGMTDIGESYIKMTGYYTILTAVPATDVDPTTPPFLAAALLNDLSIEVTLILTLALTPTLSLALPLTQPLSLSLE